MPPTPVSLSTSNTSTSTGNITNTREVFFQPVVNFGTPGINQGQAVPASLPGNNFQFPDLSALVSEVRANNIVDPGKLTGSVINATPPREENNNVLILLGLGLAFVVFVVMR